MNGFFYKDKYSNSRGSALFIILIGVALFAALGYAVSNMMQGGTSGTNIAEEQSKLYASEIIDYGRAMRETIQGMRISNGCADNEISFENDVVSGYENTNAPSDFSCHVFRAEGGGANWIKAPSIFTDGTDYVFEYRVVADIGTTSSGASELILGLQNVNYNICKQINKIHNDYDGEPYPQANVAGFGAQKFQGSYNFGPHINSPNLHGQRAGCFGDNNAKIYY